jgi:hypothetical protein
MNNQPYTSLDSWSTPMLGAEAWAERSSTKLVE